MTDNEAEVRGPFATQPLLVKVGTVAAFVSVTVFGVFIPTTVIVAFVGGVGQPAPHWTGTAGALAFFTALAAGGAWMACSFLRWLLGGVLGRGTRLLFVSGTVVASALVAAAAVALGVFPTVFLVAFALVVVGIVASSVLIKLGQIIAGRT